MTHPHPKRSFIPQAVLTRTGKINTAGANVNIAGASTNIVFRPINTTASTPIVNHLRPKSNAYKRGYSQSSRPFNIYYANKNNIINTNVNTVRVKNTTARDRAVVSENKGIWANVVKALACWIQVYNGLDPQKSLILLFYVHGNPQQKEYKEKAVIDSGCSRHITGNKCYLDKYEDYGEVELFPLVIVKVEFLEKNNVLFTDTKCLVLSSDFKLLDESQVLLRVPRKDNIYSVNLKSVVPTGGKHHKASYKTKLVNSISKPLHMLHMDLFGPTNVKSLIKKSYCLVVTDDFSRFSWVFFLATKDETCGILKTFITEIENQLDHKVKVIRCDNGTKFKNSIMNQFCEMKGIKREFSVARTPQQNGVAERKNRTLIEAARTMLVDFKLPTTFWAEADNTACYVLNRVLVIKPHNKTPYELICGRPPLIDFMKPFVCPVTILNTRDHLGKFDGKTDEGYFVGYSMVSKAMRLFNKRTL
ncbi:putative ribonuclease H-like domain-containing protein [Tanacetum coccineum]